MARATPAEPAFELRDARRGWSHARSPFNLSVEVHIEGDRRRVSSSLELLLELYGYVRHEEPCHLVGGSGTTVELEEWGTDVRFRVNYSWAVQTTCPALQAALESLLTETFQLLDRLDGTTEVAGRRAATLTALDQHVAEQGIGYDVPGLYSRLST